ncbi:hypothetical protein [Clostridium sp. AM58-1XD]|uniref:hypothetical protein n=1 Tax=Clostridium sp. AM58-1XD TaxID=2292307 RepID=UPI0011C1AD62|nr:hypothetical protein [Clostridium sp. AM58-1XD]
MKMSAYISGQNKISGALLIHLLPSQVVTVYRAHIPYGIVISIHTTFADGDEQTSGLHFAGMRFQSTPPSQVVTLFADLGIALILFQSTPPSQVVTEGRDRLINSGMDFNPHHLRRW